MKYFVFSDVHGCYSELVAALNKAGFEASNPNHMLISCGDNFDRGEENYSMLKFLVGMLKANKLIAICGNHELLLEELYNGRPIYGIDESNGTADTCCNFICEKDGLLTKEKKSIVGYNVFHRLGQDYEYFITQLRPSFETKNYIFTHGFLPTTDNGYSWRKSTWDCGFKEIRKFPQKKTVVFGHFYTYLAREFEEGKKIYPIDIVANSGIYYGKGYIAIDGCTPFTKIVNVLVVDDEEGD